jgi:Zn-dependent protease
MDWWASTVWNISPMLLVSWVFWVIASIVLHELGHGAAAIRRGDYTPAETGHMTWNPMVHMGGLALIMFAIFGFTWGLMPVDPTRMRGRYAEAFVAAAGPFVNLCLFLVITVLNVLWLKFGHGAGDPLYTNLFTFLWAGSAINLMGLVFNLIPFPPLDGSRILGNFVPAFERLWTRESMAVVGLIAFVLLFRAGGQIWGFVFDVTDRALLLGTEALGAGRARPPI